MNDYPGFNLRYAKKLHDLGIPVIYYVSPQVWAWNKKRIPEIARVVTKMMVIFPFEVDTYNGTSLDVEFVGHPLAELLNETPAPVEREVNTILLMPGSRTSEIKRLLKPMVETAIELRRKNPELNFVLPTPRERIKNCIDEMLDKMNIDTSFVKVECGNTVEWMKRATAGIAASGTVTVQAAIVGLPLISTYRLNSLTYLIAKHLVKIPFFTMPNVIAGHEVYKEFLQSDVCAAKLAPALEAILPGGTDREEVEQGMTEVIEKLGGRAGALKRTAEVILETINKK